jgi:hypothetical protein
MRGRLEALPLDDHGIIEAARPIRPDGTVKVDAAALQARHDGQVKRALLAGSVAVLVLGASHDLSASVRRLGAGRAEYIRVTTKRVKEYADEGAEP